MEPRVDNVYDVEVEIKETMTWGLNVCRVDGNNLHEIVATDDTVSIRGILIEYDVGNAIGSLYIGTQLVVLTGIAGYPPENELPCCLELFSVHLELYPFHI